MAQKNNDLVSLDDAGKVLSEMITRDTVMPIKFNTFDDFVQDIFAKCYPNRNFNVWHIRRIATFLDEVMKTEMKMGVIVLPRYHLKSTICGYAFSIYRFLTSFGDGFYCSYKDELANYHRSQIKRHIAENPTLNTLFTDLRPRSDFEIYYKIGAGKRVQMKADGIFSMKRGYHTDGVVIVDDVLGNVDNPMMLQELEKAGRIFDAELMQIPNRGCPLILFGTVMHHTDLLFTKSNNPMFDSLWLPAEHPDSNHEVLWQEQYPMNWLQMRKQGTGWKAYSTEFLLTPVLETEAFFTRDELPINKTLKNYRFYEDINKEDKHVVAGYDVGKRRNPSHLAVFIDDDYGNLKMVHESFYDNVDYEAQVEKLKEAIDAFGIDRLYYDNTRSELEDRNLPRQCVPIKFSGRGQRNRDSFAADFAKAVENKWIELIDDDRMIASIMSMDKSLKAPETSVGHADAFFSIALAVGAYVDNYAPFRKQRIRVLGNMNETLNITPRIDSSQIINKDMTAEQKIAFMNNFIKFNKNSGMCMVCKGKEFEMLDNGRRKCIKCQAIWE